MSESTNGFDAETRARINCAEQFDETGTHLPDCPCARIRDEAYTPEEVAERIADNEACVQPEQHIRRWAATVAALTAENERLAGLLTRSLDYADHATCKLSDGYGDPCTCGYEQWQIDAAAALPSSRETTDG